MSRAKSIFLASLKQDTPASRRAYAEQACAEDAALRARVLELLAADEEMGAALPPDEAAGTRIGPYRLLEVIGEGGFGVVHVAEQMEPVRRRVAIKLIKPGMDSREVLARFDAERQALAMMDHPCIARILDAGTTDHGRPYFVMELVPGVPLTRYCTSSELSLRERLGLFVQVCRAVQHAHQKGIIHRDLKPSNVLVALQDGVPCPRIIDFGLAKAMEVRLTDETYHTRFAQFIGTPQYMSPEQAEMSPLGLDTRSDVYSLGVLLYELLTSTTPFTRERLQQVELDELIRVIREEEPETPSTRLRSQSASADPSSGAPRRVLELARAVHGDLDQVVMRALQKDRARRYESAGALADDVERFLRDEPVVARPPSVAYRLRKFARRRRRMITVCAVALAALTVAGASLESERRRRARTRADVAAAFGAAERLRGEAWADVSRPSQHAAKLAAARAALAPALSAAADTGAGVPDGLATRARQLARALEADTADDQAIRAFDGLAVDRQLETAGLEAPLLREKWAGLYRQAFRGVGFDAGATPPADVAAYIGARHPTVRNAFLVACLEWRGVAGDDVRAWLEAVIDGVPADGILEEVRDAARAPDRALAALTERPALLQSPAAVRLVASALRAGGDAARAADLLRRGRDHHPGDFWLVISLGDVLLRTDPEAAVPCYRTAMALRPRSAGVHVSFGQALMKTGDIDGVVAANQRAIELDDHLAAAHGNLGAALNELGDLPAAEAACRRAIDLDPVSSPPRVTLGGILLARGDFAASRAELDRACEINPNNPAAWSNLCHTLRELGELDAAARAGERALALDPDAMAAHIGIGHVRRVRGDLRGALESFKRAAALSNHTPNLAAVANSNVAAALRQLEHPVLALPYLERAIELSPRFVDAYENLGGVLLDLDRYEAARVVLERAIGLGPRMPGVLHKLGIARTMLGDDAGAIEAHRAAIDIQPDFTWAHSNLAVALFVAGRDDEGAVAMREASRLGERPGRFYRMWGEVLWRRGAVDRALELTRKSTRVDPDYLQSYVQLGRIELSRGRHAEAARHFRDAIARDAQFPWPYTGLGQALAQGGDHRGAVSAFLDGIAVYPRDPEAQQGLGDSLRATGDLPGALAAYGRAFEIDPRDTSTRVRVGTTQRELGDLDAAVATLRAAVQRDVDDVDACVELGRTEYLRGDFEAALRSARRATALRASSPSAQVLLGDCLRETGDLDAALTAHQAAAAGDAPPWRALVALSCTLRQLGRPADAVAATRRAATDDARRPDVRAAMARSVYDAGQRETALEMWRTLLADVETTGSPRDRVRSELAQVLATVPELLDPQRAVALARSAATARGDWISLSILGVALSSAGDDAGALDAVRRSVGIRAPTARDQFVTAACSGRLGQRARARAALVRGVRWMEEHAPADPELARLRGVAEGVLKAGVKR